MSEEKRYFAAIPMLIQTSDGELYGIAKDQTWGFDSPSKVYLRQRYLQVVENLPSDLKPDVWCEEQCAAKRMEYHVTSDGALYINSDDGYAEYRGQGDNVHFADVTDILSEWETEPFDPDKSGNIMQAFIGERSYREFLAARTMDSMIDQPRDHPSYAYASMHPLGVTLITSIVAVSLDSPLRIEEYAAGVERQLTISNALKAVTVSAYHGASDDAIQMQACELRTTVLASIRSNQDALKAKMGQKSRQRNATTKKTDNAKSRHNIYLRFAKSEIARLEKKGIQVTKKDKKIVVASIQKKIAAGMVEGYKGEQGRLYRKLFQKVPSDRSINDTIKHLFE